MKSYAWLFALLFSISTIGCGGTPAPVDHDPATDSADSDSMSEDDMAAEEAISDTGNDDGGAASSGP